MVVGRRLILLRIGLLSLLALMAGLVLHATGCGSGGSEPSTSAPAQTQPLKTRKITIKGQPFVLELALDDDAREQGLSDRKEIADDGGMLFVLPEPRLAYFVMRRCYVPIDLIYVDRKGFVDSMHRMQVIEPIGSPAWEDPSSGYSSVGSVQYVIELKGGTLDQLGLSRGEKIDLPFEELQSLVE